MIKSYIFPSAVESNNSDLTNVADNLLNGIKIYHDKEAYIVGNLALSEGISPHKNINSSPEDLDYQLLAKSGLLLTYRDDEEPVTITTGFPFSTYQLYRNEASRMISGYDHIRYDSSTFNSSGLKTVHVNVRKVDVIPEVAGCIIGLRKGEHRAKGNFFIASLGFGTFETVLSTESGIVQRTAASVNGMRYALNNMIRELNKTSYLGLKTEHQLDAGLRRGYLVLNRRKIDLTELRKESLKNYYNDIVSPTLRKAYADSDFEKASKLYLAGGGAMYDDLTNMFIEEFQDILDIEVVEDPLALASRGYFYNSLHLNGGDKDTAIGMDIGNYQTVVSVSDSDE